GHIQVQRFGSALTIGFVANPDVVRAGAQYEFGASAKAQGMSKPGTQMHTAAAVVGASEIVQVSKADAAFALTVVVTHIGLDTQFRGSTQPAISVEHQLKAIHLGILPRNRRIIVHGRIAVSESHPDALARVQLCIRADNNAVAVCIVAVNAFTAILLRPATEGFHPELAILNEAVARRAARAALTQLNDAVHGEGQLRYQLRTRTAQAWKHIRNGI